MRTIFCFGSNLAGVHGAGAAKHAAEFYGAQYGVGRGITGFSYAIPTKDSALHVLPLGVIKQAVEEFKAYAKDHIGKHTYLVTDIGCGLAGYTPEQIAPFFKDSPENVHLSYRFIDVLIKEGKDTQEEDHF